MSSLSIGKAWDEASRFLARETKLVVPVALALFVAPLMFSRWAYPADQMVGPGQLLVSFLVLLAVFAGNMTLAAMAIGWSGSVGSAISRAARRVLGFFAAVALVGLPIFVIATIVLAVMVTSAGITNPNELTPASMAQLPGFGLLGVVILLALLVFGARLLPMSAVAVMETANPFKLFVRSWRLTRGHFLRLLAVFALLLIAGAVARLATVAVVGSVVRIFAGEARPFSLSALLIALATGIVAALIWTVGAAMTGRIYVQLSAGQPGVPEVSRDA